MHVELRTNLKFRVIEFEMHDVLVQHSGGLSGETSQGVRSAPKD
jgi:hypothetical protein